MNEPALPRTFALPETLSATASGKIGVLLVNLGTPDATDYWSTRRYLKEFLSDRRVIETNPIIWWFILNGVILVRRPFISGAKYRSIWNRTPDESPLRTITRAQSEKLALVFADEPRIVIDWAMRYGSPSIEAGIDGLLAEGCNRLLVFPLYPQYAAATTATVNDKAFDRLKRLRLQPALRTVPAYPDESAYIEALAQSIRTHIAEVGWEPEAILASFHGLPQSYVDKGDPYQQQCVITTEALRRALGPLGDRLRLTFQSRFGRAEWLRPYTDQTVEQLARSGVKRLAIITPGFVADCIETLEEIGEENRDIFLEHGGEKFTVVPCLNDSDAGIGVLAQLIRRELQGWS